VPAVSHARRWVSASLSASMSTPRTEALSLASRSVTARPIPDPAPVMSATLPANRSLMAVLAITSATGED
jgi:hypothetical protein